MSRRQQSSASFLTGVRVLELADELGEYCGKLLAGLGADVVKVEPPGGERTRNYGPFYHDDPDLNRSLYFWHFNFGKRGMVLDLDSAQGRANFARLAESADVVIDTRARDFLDSRGLGYDQLSRINPALISARISPFGDDGPWADYKGSDLIHLALGGIMLNCGYDPTPEGEYDTPPIAPQMWQAYQIAGEVTAIAIVAALCFRQQSGKGQALSTSVHDAVAKNTESDFPDWVYRRSPRSRLTCRHSFPISSGKDARSAPAGLSIAMTKDGRWVDPYMTYLRGSAELAESLRKLLAKHGLGDEMSDLEFNDPGYLRSLAGTRRINPVIARLINGYTFDRDIWLEAQGEGLTWAPIRRPEENVDDPHWSQRGTFVEVEHPELGQTFTYVGAKWTARGLPWRTGPRAPVLGEHTEELLAELDRPAGQASTGSRRPASGTPKLSKHGKPWALGGVRVIDLGWIIASAGGGRFLAALGAEVIKVEHTSKIDPMRVARHVVPDGLRAERDAATGPIRPSPTNSLNRNGAFMEINAGKRAISLNLKTCRGKELFKQLIEGADVLVEGYSPGTMERMGLGYDVLREINPRLVYVQQSGMGQVGSYGRIKTFGPTAQALSGITDMSGLPEPYPPAGIGYSYLDCFGAYQIALAMVAGLYRQRITGEGCWIDSSQVEAGIYLTGTAVLDHSVNGRRWSRYGNRSPYKQAAPHGAYHTRGADRWIALAAFDETEWLALVRTLGVPELAEDPRFATLQLRLQNQDSLDELIDLHTRTRDGIELMTGLQTAGVAAGICQTAEDRCDWDPQLNHLQWTVELDQTEIGRWPTRTAPTRFSETSAHQGGVVDRHGPNYAEDNRYVFETILGLTPSDIEALAADGVI